ncbi:MAG: 50S ribosomal protein L29 [bacterium]|nr:50S ribosomal protein L29 [bacterium]
MKTKEFLKELDNKNIKQLNESLIKQRDKLHELKRDLALGKVKNISEIPKVKKQIAQIITVINIKAGKLLESDLKEPDNE